MHESFLWRPGERSACHTMFGCLIRALAIRIRRCRWKNINLWMELYATHNLKSKSLIILDGMRNSFVADVGVKVKQLSLFLESAVVVGSLTLGSLEWLRALTT